jgi:glutamate-1-semialdehyde 2,1-aminomutase
MLSLLSRMICSEDLFERACKVMPGGVNSPVRAFRSVGGTPFFTQSAQGSKLTTVDGRELVDYVCTWGPAIHGHNAKEVRSAIATALEQGTSFGTPNPYEVEMAELVVDMVPSIEQVRFCNSGTEATMSALRLARGVTGRDLIIKFAGCYHGHVDSLLVQAGSGAVTLGNPDSAGVPAAIAGTTLVVEYNDPQALAECFAAYPQQIAAVIMEPVPANCGLLLPDAGFLQQVRELCTSNGSLLIFDEVMTGFRVAQGGVQQWSGVQPDLTALGKIIGGGLPVGAFGGKRLHMQHLAPVGPVYQAGTLSGNPLAMAAGCAALRMLVETDPYADLQSKGQALADALLAAASAKGMPLQVPHIGSMFAVFFAEQPVRNFSQAIASTTKHFSRFFHEALAGGVYLPPSAYETCFISTAHSQQDIDFSIEVLTKALNAL